MATINRSSIGNLHDKLTVTLSQDDYMPSFEKALKNYSKNANIPGFRKGQVPTGMVKKMYGQSVFVEEVLRKAYDEVDAYLKENNPNIFAQPLPMPNEAEQNIDYKNPGDYSFTFEMGLKPEVTIDAIDNKAALTKYEIAINDEMLDREIEVIRKRAGKLEDKDAQDNEQDLVYMNYHLLNADKVKTEDKPSEDVAEYSRLPKVMQEALKGAKTGTTFTFSPSEISDETEKTAFLRDALKIKEEQAENTYEVEVTKVASLVPRDMDETFFNDVFPGKDIKDEATFRNEMKGALKQQVQKFSNERLQNDIFETLVHNTKIEMPEAFLKNWLMKGGEKLKTEEEVEKEWPTFEHQLRWTLISDQLIGKYGIQVTYDEIMQDIKDRVTQYFGMNAEDEAPWLQSYLEKMSKDQNTIEETHRRLMMDKLFVAIEKDLSITTQEVTEEEFSKIPALHQH